MDDAQRLIALFVRYLKADTELLADIAGFDGDCTLVDHEWRFTLPALHAYVQQHVPGFRVLPYPAFRKLLFNTPINHTLSQQGGEAVIIEPHDHIDKTLYAIRRR